MFVISTQISKHTSFNIFYCIDQQSLHNGEAKNQNQSETEVNMFKVIYLACFLVHLMTSQT